MGAVDILIGEVDVDVKLITPGWPDKKTVFALTRSYYRELIAGGVQIYEYTPGFIHAKTFVIDDAALRYPVKSSIPRPSAFHICRNMRVKVRTASPVKTALPVPQAVGAVGNPMPDVRAPAAPGIHPL